MKSWKIGAVSGLIGGIIQGVVTIFIAIILFNFGLPYWHVTLQDTPIFEFASINIIIAIIWGIILGAIYSKTYGVIPSRGVWKGLIYGLFIFLIYAVRFSHLLVAYGQYIQSISGIIGDFIPMIIYGLFLGYMYEFLCNRYNISKEKPKIIQYEMMSGFYPGAVAGLIAGIVTFFSYYTYSYSLREILHPDIMLDLGFILGQLGSQAMVHMIWGIIFGMIFPKVYNLIPAKGMVKGLIYGFVIAFLINELHAATWALCLGRFMYAHGIIFTGGTQAIIFGLVLGLLYRKPTK